MKKIFTTLALSTLVAVGANAQRFCDIKLTAVYDTAVTINCVDSFQWGYTYMNNGPDALVSGDTLYFIDHNADSGLVYFLPVTTTINPGDTVANWYWTDHYSFVKRLVNPDFTYNFNDPFANGTYKSPIFFAGFSSDSTVVTDTVSNNDGALITLTIDCEPESIFTPNNGLSLSIFPNPVNNMLNVSINLDKAGTASMRILDVMGREVLAKNYGTLYSGSQNLSIDVNNLPNGFYTVELFANDQRGTSKFTIRK